MAKTYEQNKKESIIFCPRHGRLSLMPDLACCQDANRNSHYFYLAYCHDCGVYYATYQALRQIQKKPAYRGMPISIVEPLTPQQAKKIEEVRAQEALAAKRKAEEERRKAIETKAAREEWEEIFNPKEMDFATLFAEQMGDIPRRPAQKKVEPKAQKPSAAPSSRPDPYAKKEAKAVDEIFLAEKTPRCCPLHQTAVLEGQTVLLQLKDGQNKKISGLICPECGRCFVHKKSFHSLGLDRIPLAVAVHEELPEK